MRDPRPEPEDDLGRDPAEPQGNISPIGWQPLVGLAAVGFGVGFALTRWATGHWVAIPPLGWMPGFGLVFLAAVLGVTARRTRKDLAARSRQLEGYQAVNRMAFGRAAACGGALLAGAYAGYAAHWTSVIWEVADRHLFPALLGVAGGIGVMIGGVVLERACRLPERDDKGLT